jgi:GT2 family glycosyltransferase
MNRDGDVNHTMAAETDASAPCLSIVVISYNTADLTMDCLQSVYREAVQKSFEVIVLDNASSDDSVKKISESFPHVRLVTSKKNHGFAKGNNLAVGDARGEWVLLLNPDTVVKNYVIDALLKFAIKHTEASIFGGRTLFADGTLNPSSCWAGPTMWSSFCNGAGLASLFPRSSFFNPEGMGNWQRNTIRQVDIVTGCFLLLRKRDWQDLGGFNEDYFMYGEDADLCLRAAKRGLKCMICPDAEIIHYGGASEKVHADKMVRLFCAKSKLFTTHWNRIASKFGILTLDLWAFVRLLAYSVSHSMTNAKAEQLNTWLHVWQNRKEWHS